MQRTAVLLSLSLALAGCVQTGPTTWSFRPSVPEVGRGRAIAERVCAECHVVGAASHARRGSSVGAAPPFAEVAGRYDRIGLEHELEASSRIGHYQMKPLALTPDEITDLAAYIQSVRAR